MRTPFLIRFLILGLLATVQPFSRADGPPTQSPPAAQEKPFQEKQSDPASATAGSNQKAALTAAANKIWKARSERDCKTVGRYLDPKEYTTQSLEDRIKICEGDPFRYENYRVGEVEEGGGYGWVHVNYSAKIAPYGDESAQEIETVEKWRLLDGVWYPVASRIQETCPEPPSKRDAAEEKKLRERFDLTWKMRLAKDWKALYQLTDPKDRSQVSESDYAESEGLIEYYEHELEWAEVIGDIGKIRVTYTNKLADPNMSKIDPRKINIAEHWIKRNGEWYRDLLRTK